MSTKDSEPQDGEKGSGTAVVERRDGSTQIVDKFDNSIISETNSKGKRRVRINIDPVSGGSGSKTGKVSNQVQAGLQDRGKKQEVQQEIVRRQLEEQKKAESQRLKQVKELADRTRQLNARQFFEQYQVRIRNDGSYTVTEKPRTVKETVQQNPVRGGTITAEQKRGIAILPGDIQKGKVPWYEALAEFGDRQTAKIDSSNKSGFVKAVAGTGTRTLQTVGETAQGLVAFTRPETYRNLYTEVRNTGGLDSIGNSLRAEQGDLRKAPSAAALLFLPTKVRGTPKNTLTTFSTAKRIPTPVGAPFRGGTTVTNVRTGARTFVGDGINIPGRNQVQTQLRSGRATYKDLLDFKVQAETPSRIRASNNVKRNTRTVSEQVKVDGATFTVERELVVTQPSPKRGVQQKLFTEKTQSFDGLTITERKPLENVNNVVRQRKFSPERTGTQTTFNKDGSLSSPFRKDQTLVVTKDQTFLVETPRQPSVNLFGGSKKGQSQLLLQFRRPSTKPSSPKLPDNPLESIVKSKPSNSLVIPRSPLVGKETSIERVSRNNLFVEIENRVTPVNKIDISARKRLGNRNTQELISDLTITQTRSNANRITQSNRQSQSQKREQRLDIFSETKTSQALDPIQELSKSTRKRTTRATPTTAPRLKLPRAKKSKSQSFDLTLGQKGNKFFSEIKGLSLEQAARKGKKASLNSAIAGLDIRPQGRNKLSKREKLLVESILGKQFKRSKQGNRFVQKNRFRINTIGEVRDIPLASKKKSSLTGSSKKTNKALDLLGKGKPLRKIRGLL